ncbi:hypothetical protein P171DRAFT_241916 [Karstenula rhodostoma CBS 690.94]|uniref:Uncharacterized protein n=1 Tax=Karstenula rhodostoma CBS 690.94 TaxID=1392251 RepID=A0A9P4PQ44_9PLEO|nr:hypothetical protein P171DRAFT_241916 [Karstenula rhodostoma CBS 690.94]
MKMHAELSGKLRAARKTLQDEQAALQKEREAHLCTLTVQEALIDEAARHATKEATETARRYVRGQKDRIQNARGGSIGTPLKLDEEAEMSAARENNECTATALAKHIMEDSMEEKRECKRVAPDLSSLVGLGSQSESPKSMQKSHQGSEMFSKRLDAAFGQTQNHHRLFNSSDIAGFDGSKGEEGPLRRVAGTSSPVSGLNSSAPPYSLRHRRPNNRYVAFSAVTRRRSGKSVG